MQHCDFLLCQNCIDKRCEEVARPTQATKTLGVNKPASPQPISPTATAATFVMPSQTANSSVALSQTGNANGRSPVNDATAANGAELLQSIPAGQSSILPQPRSTMALAQDIIAATKQESANDISQELPALSTQKSSEVPAEFQKPDGADWLRADSITDGRRLCF